MGLEHILKKIREETDREMLEVNSGIEKKGKEIAEDGDKKITQLRDDLFRKAEEKAEEEKRSELAKARLDFRKKLLEEKQKLLGETFQTAFEYVRNLDDNSYRNLVKKLVLENAEPGKGKIIVSQKDGKKIDKSLVKEINETLTRSGKPASYELSHGDIDIGSGFILKTGDVEINCSLDTLFKQKREELEVEVSAILF